MMIALPNLDGSFTCTLFWPYDGPHSFAELHDRGRRARLFPRHLPRRGAADAHLGARLLREPRRPRWSPSAAAVARRDGGPARRRLSRGRAVLRSGHERRVRGLRRAERMSRGARARLGSGLHGLRRAPEGPHRRAGRSRPWPTSSRCAPARRPPRFCWAAGSRRPCTGSFPAASCRCTRWSRSPGPPTRSPCERARVAAPRAACCWRGLLAAGARGLRLPSGSPDDASAPLPGADLREVSAARPAARPPAAALRPRGARRDCSSSSSTRCTSCGSSCSSTSWTRSRATSPPNDLFGAIHTFKRARTVMKTLVGQLDILETMTPMSFSGFRNRLDTASGFQSFQFRELEFMLGLKRADMLRTFEPHARGTRTSSGGSTSRRSSTASTTSSSIGGGDPAGAAGARDHLARQPQRGGPGRVLRALREQPDVAILLELMTDFDEGLQEWRYRHVKLVERTIGNKAGTGGSSGVEFLKRTLFKPLFEDLWAIRHRFDMDNCRAPSPSARRDPGRTAGASTSGGGRTLGRPRRGRRAPPARRSGRPPSSGSSAGCCRRARPTRAAG